MKPQDLNAFLPRKFPVKPGVRNFSNPIRCLGFDTETQLDGRVILAARSDGAYCLGDVLDDLLAFLTRRDCYDTINFFYNLEFDHNAILKTVLDKKQLGLLASSGMCVKGKYLIKIIPGKMLKIRKNNLSWNYYDISQFYGRIKLTSAYEKTFGESYVKRIDASREFQDVDDEMITYCIEDAAACQRLSAYFIDAANKLVPLKKPISGASLAKKLLQKNLKKPYRATINKLQKYAMLAYGGGRIECFRRGNWDGKDGKNLYVYDIRSAYPSVQCDLKEVIGSIISEKPEYIPDANHSFYEIDADIPPALMGPIKYRKGNTIYYPTGQCGSVYVDKNELELLIDYDIPFNIKSAVHDIGYTDERPYSYLRGLYAERMRCKRSMGSEASLDLPLKLALNSSYGILIERTAHKKLVMEGITEEERNDPANQIRMGDDGYEILVKNEWMLGQFFNAVHACEVTSAIRCKLYRDAEPYQDNLVKFATDSIAFDRKIPLKIGDGLGDYDDSPPYSGVVVGPGIYRLENDGRITSRFRGFSRKDILPQMVANRDKNILSSVKKSPVKLKESGREDFLWLGVFTDKIKDFDLNFDTRRIWEPVRLSSFNDILTGIYESRPPTFQELERIQAIPEDYDYSARDLVDIKAYTDSSLRPGESGPRFTDLM